MIGGVTVGDGAVIGAGTVVTRDVDAYAIAVGAPERALRYRFPEALGAEPLALKWWELDREVIECPPHANTEKCLRILRLLRSSADSKVNSLPHLSKQR